MSSSVRSWIFTLLLAHAVVVASLATASAAHAQAPGRVSGRVLDQTGGVLPGVTIDLIVNAIEITTTTDDEGRYLFDSVPPGDAELTYRLLNFTIVRRLIAIRPG